MKFIQKLYEEWALFYRKSRYVLFYKGKAYTFPKKITAVSGETKVSDQEKKLKLNGELPKNYPFSEVAFKVRKSSKYLVGTTVSDANTAPETSYHTLPGFYHYQTYNQDNTVNLGGEKTTLLKQYGDKKQVTALLLDYTYIDTTGNPKEYEKFYCYGNTEIPVITEQTEITKAEEELKKQIKDKDNVNYHTFVKINEPFSVAITGKYKINCIAKSTNGEVTRSSYFAHLARGTVFAPIYQRKDIEFSIMEVTIYDLDSKTREKISSQKDEVFVEGLEGKNLVTEIGNRTVNYIGGENYFMVAYFDVFDGSDTPTQYSVISPDMNHYKELKNPFQFGDGQSITLNSIKVYKKTTDEKDLMALIAAGILSNVTEDTLELIKQEKYLIDNHKDKLKIDTSTRISKTSYLVPNEIYKFNNIILPVTSKAKPPLSTYWLGTNNSLIKHEFEISKLNASKELFTIKAIQEMKKNDEIELAEERRKQQELAEERRKQQELEKEVKQGKELAPSLATSSTGIIIPVTGTYRIGVCITFGLDKQTQIDALCFKYLKKGERLGLVNKINSKYHIYKSVSYFSEEDLQSNNKNIITLFDKLYLEKYTLEKGRSIFEKLGYARIDEKLKKIEEIKNDQSFAWIFTTHKDVAFAGTKAVPTVFKYDVLVQGLELKTSTGKANLAFDKDNKNVFAVIKKNQPILDILSSEDETTSYSMSYKYLTTYKNAVDSQFIKYGTKNKVSINGKEMDYFYNWEEFYDSSNAQKYHIAKYILDSGIEFDSKKLVQELSKFLFNANSDFLRSCGINTVEEKTVDVINNNYCFDDGTSIEEATKKQEEEYQEKFNKILEVLKHYGEEEKTNDIEQFKDKTYKTIGMQTVDFGRIILPYSKVQFEKLTKAKNNFTTFYVNPKVPDVEKELETITEFKQGTYTRLLVNANSEITSVNQESIKNAVEQPFNYNYKWFKSSERATMFKVFKNGVSSIVKLKEGTMTIEEFKNKYDYVEYNKSGGAKVFFTIAPVTIEEMPVVKFNPSDVIKKKEDIVPLNTPCQIKNKTYPASGTYDISYNDIKITVRASNGTRLKDTFHKFLKDSTITVTPAFLDSDTMNFNLYKALATENTSILTYKLVEKDKSLIALEEKFKKNDGYVVDNNDSFIDFEVTQKIKANPMTTKYIEPFARYNKEELSLQHFDASNLISAAGLLKKVNTKKVTGLNLGNNPKIKNLDYFLANTTIETIENINIDFSNIESARYLFENANIKTWVNFLDLNAHQLKDFSFAFANALFFPSTMPGKILAKNLSNLGNGNKQEYISMNWKIENVESFESAFTNMPNAKTATITFCNTSKLKTMKNMFAHCPKLTRIDIPIFRIDETVDIENAFMDCPSLREIYISGDAVHLISKKTGINDNVKFYVEPEALGYAREMAPDFSNRIFPIKLKKLHAINNSSEKEVTLQQSDVTEEQQYCDIDNNTSVINCLGATNISHEKNIGTLLKQKLPYLESINKTFMFADIKNVKKIISKTEIELSMADTASLESLNNVYFTYQLDIETQNIKNLRLGEITDLSFFENDDIKYFLPANNSFDHIFYASKISNFDFIKKWDTKDITNTNYMFKDCAHVKEIDLSQNDFSKVKTAKEMFAGCEAEKIKLPSKFDPENSDEMFKGCKKLKEINLTSFTAHHLKDILDESPNAIVTIPWFMYNKAIKLYPSEAHRIKKDNETYDFIINSDKGETCNSKDRSNIDLNYPVLFYSTGQKIPKFSEPLIFVNFTYIDMDNIINMDNMLLDSAGYDVFKMPKNSKPVVSAISMFENCVELKYLDLSQTILADNCKTENMFKRAVDLKGVKIGEKSLPALNDNTGVEDDVIFYVPNNIIDVVRAKYPHLWNPQLNIFRIKPDNNMPDPKSEMEDMLKDYLLFPMLPPLSPDEEIELGLTEKNPLQKKIDLRINAKYMTANKLKDINIESYPALKEIILGDGTYNIAEEIIALNRDIDIIIPDKDKYIELKNKTEYQKLVLERNTSPIIDINTSQCSLRYQNNTFLVKDAPNGHLCLKDFKHKNVTLKINQLNSYGNKSYGRNIRSLKNCFKNTKNLETFVLKNSVQVIEFGENVETINSMFYGAKNLKLINLENANFTNPKLLEEGNMENAFVDIGSPKIILGKNALNVLKHEAFKDTVCDVYVTDENIENAEERKKKENLKVNIVPLIDKSVLTLDVPIGRSKYDPTIHNKFCLDPKVTDASIFFENYRQSEINLKKFNTDNVTSMNGLFHHCDRLSKIDLSNFKTQKVIDMTGMFSNCQKLDSLNLKNFDTSNVRGMSYMFYCCNELENLNISSFNTSNVENMGHMFNGCYKLTDLDTSKFNTQKVRNMQYMFSDCNELKTLNLKSFNTMRVVNMGAMFYGCYNLTSLDLSNFNTRNVTNMASMFGHCRKLESLNLKSFNTEKVKDMSHMFSSCDKLTSLDFDFNTEKVTKMNNMFYDCKSLTGLCLSKFKVNNVTNMNSMFFGCNKLKKIMMDDFNLTNVTDMSYMFKDCHELTEIEGMLYNTSKVTNMISMFFNCKKLDNIDYITKNFDTGNVTNMSGMFFNCQNATHLSLYNFDTSNVTDMGNMFYGCESLNEVFVGSFDTSKVTNMKSMFSGCKKIKTLNSMHFNTSNVTSMEEMFYNCKELSRLNLETFDTSNVTTMESMFSGCTYLNGLNLTMFNTTKVVNMRNMFNGCTYLGWLDISSFDTSNVKDMESMFWGCNSLSSVKLGEKSLDVIKVKDAPSGIIFYVPDNKLEEARTTYNTLKYSEYKIQPWSELPE